MSLSFTWSFRSIITRNMWADLGDALSQQFLGLTLWADPRSSWARYTGAASTMGATLRQGGHTARAMLEKGWQAMNRAACAENECGAVPVKTQNRPDPGLYGPLRRRRKAGGPRPVAEASEIAQGPVLVVEKGFRFLRNYCFILFHIFFDVAHVGPFLHIFTGFR